MNPNKNKTEEDIYIEKGDALYKEKLYKEAIAEYNNALKINSRNLMTQLKIAKAKLSDNNLNSPAAAYDPGEKHPPARKPSEIEVTAVAPERKRPSSKAHFVRNLIFIIPVVIIIVLAVWYFIDASENKIDFVPLRSTAEINARLSPEGADLIFGKTENPEPAKTNAPVKPVTEKKPIKRIHVEVTKNEDTKKASSQKPVTGGRIVKGDKKAAREPEAENVEEPGFWAALKEYILSLFKGSKNQGSGGKGIIRDPLGAEKR